MTRVELGHGLRLSLVTIFEALELRDLEPGRELVDLAQSLTDRERTVLRSGCSSRAAACRVAWEVVDRARG